MRHTDVQSDVSSSNSHFPKSITEQVLTHNLVNLNALIKQHAERLLPLLEPNIRLKCFFADGLFPVQIEPSRIDDILRSLFENARDRMGTADGILLIQTNNVCLERKSQPYVVVTVASTEETATIEPRVTTRNAIPAAFTLIDRIVKDNGGFIVDVPNSPQQPAEMKLYFPSVTD
jgi:hypothetical protein